MRIPILLTFSLFLATSSFAASIVNVTPRLGTVNGGDVVEITVDTTLHSCAVCSPPSYFATVTFDGIPAREVFAWDKTIWATTPSRPRGTVDIAVISESPSSPTLSYGTAKFTFAGWGGPIEPRNYERILVPLALPEGKVIPGAFGSRWATEFWVSNQSNYPAEFFNDISCTVICPGFAAPEPPYPTLRAKEVLRLSPFDFDGAGYLYYLQKGFSDDVDFSLHVADQSRADSNAGTELGVVRESELRVGSFEILNVPVDDVSRATLRVYDTDPQQSFTGGANVEIFAMNDGRELFSGNVEAPIPAGVRTPNTEIARQFPVFAGVGLLDLQRALEGFHGRVRIRVNMQYGARGWAFVSVTNNATQLITTHRPS